MKNSKGFTLTELMIVIAILMILAGAMVAKIGSGTEKANNAKATAEMEEIASAMRAFYADTGYWCYNGNWVRDPGLVSKDEVKAILRSNGNNGDSTDIDIAKSRWKGPYLEAKEWPFDPWGRYKYHIAVGAGCIAVISPGADLSWISGGWYRGQLQGDDLMTLIHRFR